MSELHRPNRPSQDVSKVFLVVSALCVLLWSSVLLTDARQTVDIPPIIYVNKNRTWKKDIVNLTTFRPNINLTKYFTGGNNTHIPRWATPIIQPKLAMHSTVTVPSTGFIVAFGGMMERDDLPNQPFELGTNKTYLYDPVTATWFTEPTFTNVVPPRRLDHASFTFGDYVYVHGGEDEIVRSDTWRYTNRTWRKQAWSIPDRTGHSIDTVTMPDGTQVAFLFGGRDEAGVYHRKIYNITLEGVVKEVVVRAGEAPIPRAYHASSIMYSPTQGPILLVHGGYDGNMPLKDLFGFYILRNQWVRINSLGSGTTTQFDGSFTLGISPPTVWRHKCLSQWPTMFCVGGKSTGDPIVLEFDIVLNRYIEQFFNNPLYLAPLQGHTMIASLNTSNITEALVIGGFTGTPKQFTTPVTVHATTLQYDACPYPYLNPDWVGTCVTCPRGSGVNTTLNPHRCNPCPMGTFSDYSRCERCPRGTFNPRNASANVTSCVPCPAGSFTRYEGSWTHTQCITCPNGTYANDGYCVDCPSGTRGVMSGALHMDEGCKPCPYGSYADRGAITCTTCPPGTSGPSFIRNLDGYHIVHDGVQALQAASIACTTGAMPAIVDNRDYMRFAFSVRDWGETGLVHLNGYPRLNTNTLGPLINLYVYFDGPGVMLYNCQTGGPTYNPSCSSVGPNVTTPIVAPRGYAAICQFQYLFDLRFLTPAPKVKLYVKGDGLRGLEYTFSVVNKYNQIRLTQWPAAVVVGQPFPLSAYAILNEVAVGYSNFSTQIRIQCLFTDPTAPPGTAATAPMYTVEDDQSVVSTAANLQTINVVESIAKFRIDMRQTAGLCTFYNKHDYGDVLTNSYTGFTVQRVFAMYARLLTTNTSNWGIMRVEVAMVDHKEGIVTGDSSSRVQLQLWPGSTSVMENGPMIQQVEKGKTIFTVRVHSNDMHKVFSYGKFQAIHLSGLPTLMPDNITERFWTGHVNGTMLRLKNNASESETQRTFPTVVAANTTMYIEVELVSSVTGEQDAHRDVYVQVQMLGCGTRITLLNHTASTVIAKLAGGHGVIALYLRGQDSSGCRLSVFEHVTTLSKPIAKGFITPSFDVRTARKAVHNSTCQPSDCASLACEAVYPIAGTVRTYNISLHTLLNQIVLIENSYVIRARPTGNVSAMTFIGDSEKVVSQGSVAFTVKFGMSTNATGLIFEVGRWEQIIPLNFTYRTEPYFSRFVRENPRYRRFVKNNAIQSTQTCPFIPKIIATEMRLHPDSLRTLSWIPQNEEHKIKILATNEFGVQDTEFYGTMSVRLSNCEQGVYRDLTMTSIHPKTRVSTTIYSPTTVPRAPLTHVASNFDHGNGELILFPTFTIDADKDGGIRKCSLMVTCPGLTTLYIDPLPEIRKVYPNCEICKPGYWSSGGDGVNTSITYHHPGGCMPCPLGTFAAFSGATTERACAACQKNYGYHLDWWYDNTPREGVIECQYHCTYGSGGQAGGGYCTSLSNIARTDTWNNLNAPYGRTGRYCSASGCGDAPWCPATTYYLNCQTLVTQDDCEHDDNNFTCTWNLLTNTCDGSTFNCVPCPAGTVGKTSCRLCSKAAVCTPCDPGSYSTVRGLPTSQYTEPYWWNEYSCDNINYPYRRTRCNGPGVFLCPEGTYSVTYGARDDSVCQPCPRGFYCPHYKGRTYPGNVNNANSVNPYCPPACTTGRTTCATGCYQCPYDMQFTLGNFIPIPCPSGTFYNKTGAFLRTQCRTCPAGTKCPEGSASPIWVDNFNTQESDGQVTPQGLTFYGSDDTTMCGIAELSDNAQGYVQDGRISLWKQAFTNNGGVTSFRPQINYVEHWGGKSWRYDATDRSGATDSGSILMNATGAIATQRLQLDHELPLESVARVWVQFNLYMKNLSAVRPKPPDPFCGLTVGIHYTNGSETDSYNFTQYSKTFSGTPQLVPNSTKIISAWYLIEILVQPLRPIKWVDFTMLVQGYYFGNARFDDASFKPSHRRICNCSTGFYFNQSERSSRVCRRCPPGFACSGGTMIRCVNSWSAVSFAGCQYCYDGWECDADGRGRQIPCARYNKHDGSTETCSPCPLGHACRDGIQTTCDNGFYGDGGNDCVPCQPGYYSLAGAPRVQCERCPPGTTSVAARWYCTGCEENHYSYKGLECRRCPDGTYAPYPNSTECFSCLDAVLQAVNTTVSRNAREVAIRVVPRYCEPWFKFETERVVDDLNGHLAQTFPSNETPSVLYRAGPVLGMHTFSAFVTSNYLAPEQSIPVAVEIINNAPIAQDDTLTLSHPKTLFKFELTTLLFNDYDDDLDDIFFADAYLAPGLPTYGAYNVEIATDRKSISVLLPGGYIGPTYLNYTIMDQYYADAVDCVSPHCKVSKIASVMFYCVDAFPVATDDVYSYPVGNVYPIPVLTNDYDIDGDEIVITSVTAGSLSNIYPAIQLTCPTCPRTCVGSWPSACSCVMNTSRGKCFPSNGHEYFLDYTASTVVCGIDRFSYSILTRDGAATADVAISNTRCYCDTKAIGFNVIFVLDGTTSISDFGFQLSLADGIMRRSREGAMFYYGIVEVGTNRMLVNLSNTFFSVDHLSRAPEGHRTFYTLGKGLQLARQMNILYGGSGRTTYVITVANKNSYDNANPEILGTSMMTVSVSSSLQQLPMFVDQFKSSSYNGVAETFVKLTQNEGDIPEKIMDFMCSH